MRSRVEYERVMSLVAAGWNDSQIARETGIPRATVQWWRAGGSSRHIGGDNARPGQACDGECDGVEVNVVPHPRRYAHLLGLYLGDGTISHMKRGVMRLRIFLDQSYPRIIEGCIESMEVIRGSGRVSTVQQTGCLEVSSCWKHWTCVFPQHGPGMKHTRPIVLEPWQKSIVVSQPEAFLQGLYESDGSRHVNPITRHLPSGTRTYRYSRYMFTNESDDIQRLFKETCDLLGVRWTQTNRKNIAVSRRADVALLDGFLGPKR